MNSLPHSPGIYKITCLPTGKIYIGSTKDLHVRWGNHRSDLRSGTHRNSYLQRAWNKYGETAFEIEVLEYVMPWSLISREQFWLDKLKPYNSDIGFNMAEFANAPTRTNEICEKISKSHQGIRPNAEARAKMSAAKRGRTVSLETRKKMSQARMGNKNSLGSRHNLGKKHSPEHNEKTAETKRKNYVVTSPVGEEIKVHGISDFCRDNHLNHGHMVQVARGNKSHHKGWKYRYDE